MLLRRAAGFVSLFLAISGSAQQQPRTVTVQLLAINDLHANLEPPTGANGMVNSTPAGGIEYLATHIRNAERENPNSLLIGAGDLMGGSPLLSALFHDAPTIEALNALNFSVSSIGNHEFDHGTDDLMRRLQGENGSPARFSYLAANVVKTANHDQTLFPATAVKTIAGVKIGFIGETLEGSPKIISATATRGLDFLEESEVANRAAAELEREGVHAIVLLIHEGGIQRPESGPADPNGCVNLSGGIVRIANRLSPSIKVVISGHSHQFYNCNIAGHRVTSASSYGRMFTRVNLTIDAATDAITTMAATNEVVTRDVPKDPAESAILDKYRPRVAAVADRKAGSITTEIGGVTNEAGETQIGDIVADAHLASVAGADMGGAMISFMNSGGIRATLAGNPLPDGTREVSYNDLYSVQPFGLRITLVTMAGGALRRLLEQQFRGDATPNILQVSKGFSYQYRLNVPQDQHILPGSMMLNGKPIRSDDTVRVATLDFLLTGGDSFTVFAEGTDVLSGPLDIDSLAEYFAAHSPVAPGPRNRIERVD